MNIEKLVENTPILKDIMNLKEVAWINPELNPVKHKEQAQLGLVEMKDAELRLERLAKAIEVLFPETKETKGIIESQLYKINEMKETIETYYGEKIQGNLYLKCDCDLPVAGSIKARGGIYEVMKYAEELAIEKGMLKSTDDYSKMASPEFRELYGQYSLAVGSTGNLGLSIGISGAALGFQVTVHMSADAKQWKKDMLRSKGVNVIEYTSDYSKAVEEGRKQADQDPMCYFIDDENSVNLFMGYSVAALRLKKQLEEQNILVDKEHPLFVYLPCGVGGAPGGICFGVKELFGEYAHVFFVEPTHSPCMLVGLATGENEKISVQELGIDNITAADGLAVGRPSGFVGNVIKHQLSGAYTIEDHHLYRLLVMLRNTESIKVEPSATPGILGSIRMKDYIEKMTKVENITHIAWATGGSMVPKETMDEFISMGEALL